MLLKLINKRGTTSRILSKYVLAIFKMIPKEGFGSMIVVHFSSIVTEIVSLSKLCLYQMFITRNSLTARLQGCSGVRKCTLYSVCNNMDLLKVQIKGYFNNTNNNDKNNKRRTTITTKQQHQQQQKYLILKFVCLFSRTIWCREMYTILYL